MTVAAFFGAFYALLVLLLLLFFIGAKAGWQM